MQDVRYCRMTTEAVKLFKVAEGNKQLRGELADRTKELDETHEALRVIALPAPWPDYRTSRFIGGYTQ